MMKVILDIDTGTDDAITIMPALLLSKSDVIGICSINGSRGVELTAENILRVVEYLGITRVPVHRGCVLPMVSTLSPGRRVNISYTGPEDPEDNVHGDYVDLSSVTVKPTLGNAVPRLIDTLMESEGDITLVPMGPLTNIAMALRAEPAIAEKAKQIVLMGGGCRGANITPLMEFNFWTDPRAAKIVSGSGCDITTVPLDATRAAAISIEDAKELHKVRTKTSVMTAGIIEHRWNGYENWQPTDGINTVPVHDVLAICAILSPQVLSPVTPVHAGIDIGGGVSNGQNIFDLDRRVKRAVSNVKVILGADRALLSKMLKETLGGSGS